MSQSFNLHFYDWACSLMPQSYVLTFYIKGLPVFWNVDVECTATPHHGTLTREAVDRDPVAGLLKVWALDAKYILRRVLGIDRQVRAFGQRTFKGEALDGRECAEVMAMVLDHLRSRIQPRHREFYAACQEVYERQLLNHGS